MKDIPESEARALLTQQSFADCDQEWVPIHTQPGTFTIDLGLLDKEGVSRQMLVNLTFRRGLKTGIIKFVFTVRKRNPYGLDRVYQLEVVQSRYPLKDVHKKSHEHMGDKRLPGKSSWDSWGYDEVLRYFCAQANLTFISAPPDPEEYQLKG